MFLTRETNYLQRNNMFSYLRPFEIILITGPQRSGTTLCARIIKHDLGYTYIDEARFRIHDVQLALRQAEAYRPCVVQGPGLLKDAMVFGQLGYCAVVLMLRDTLDIADSIYRRKNNLAWIERMRRYVDTSLMTEPLNYFGEVVYNYWEDEVERHIKHLYKVDYESLSNHP